MTVAKESMFSYGATGLKSFLDNGLHEPTLLQKNHSSTRGMSFLCRYAISGAR